MLPRTQTHRPTSTKIKSIGWMLTLIAALAPGCRDQDQKEHVEAIARPLSEPNWQVGTTYRRGDLVQYNGIVWECRQDHPSMAGRQPPGNYALWQRPTPTGIGPTPWTDQTHYLRGADVSHNGSTWEALAEHVSQPDWKPGMVPTIWRKALSGSAACTNLAEGSLCDDGVACNVDTCQAGACVGSARTCGGKVVPTGDDVGSLSGSVGVTPSGTATYTIGLWTPEGRNGMTPQLALAYSSRGGDSAVGLGWGIDGGASKISRCVANSTRDPRPLPITGSSTTFCLDGQRLVLVSGSAGVANSEYRTQPDTFARIVLNETDSSGPRRFTVYTPGGLILSYGSPASAPDPSLEVVARPRQWTTDDTRREDADVVDSGTAATRQACLRGSAADRFGNKIWFRFANQGMGGGAAVQEPILAEIDYVDVGQTRTRSIRFNYVPRSTNAQRSIIVSGVTYTASKLLKSIEMRVAGPGSSVLKTVRSYQFVQTYSPLTDRPRLDSVQECDGDPASTTTRCKRATSFKYSTPSDGFMQSAALNVPDVASGSSRYWGIYIADLNHDGMSDIVYRALPPGAPATDPYRWYGRIAQKTTADVGVTFAPARDLDLERNTLTGDPIIADFNGDGFSDIAVPMTASTYAYYVNEEGLRFNRFSFDASPSSSPGIVVGDFSGRGRFSILRPNASTSNSQWTYSVMWNGFHFMSSGALPLHAETDPKVGWNTYAADVDGDMAAEILSRGSALANHLQYLRQTKVLESLTPSDPPPKVTDWGEGGSTTLLTSKDSDLVKYVFLDHNGDGLTDALRLRQGLDPPALILNHGTSFGPPKLIGGLGVGGRVALGSDTTPTEMRDLGVRVMDYDGDGRDDILLVDNGLIRDSNTVPNKPVRENLVVLLSRGTSFTTRPLSIKVGLPADGPVAPLPPWPGEGQIHNYKTSQVLDANGDGLADIIQFSPDDGALHLWIRQGGKPDILTDVEDGMGRKTAIAYLPMTNNSVYTAVPSDPDIPGCSSYGKMRCSLSTELLVSTVRTDNGRGSEQNLVTYKYNDRRYDATGGVLGFTDWTITDTQAQTILHEFFDVHSVEEITGPTGTKSSVYAKLGLPTRRISFTGGGVNRTVNTGYKYEMVPTNNGATYYARLTKSTATTTEAALADPLSVVVVEPKYEASLNDYGLMAGQTVTTTSQYVRADGSLSTGDFVESWRATYATPTSFNGPWIIGRKQFEMRCSSVPGYQEATFDNCTRNNIGMARRVVDYSLDANTGVATGLSLQPNNGPADEFLHVDLIREPAYGLLTSIVETNVANESRTTAVSFDSQGVHPRSYTNALNQTVSVSVDPGLGVPLSETDPNMLTTSFDYDGFGRLRRANYPDGSGASTGYSRTLEPNSAPAERRYATRIANALDGGGESNTLTNRLGQAVYGERRNLDGSFSFVNSFFTATGLLESTSRPATVGTAPGAATSMAYDGLMRLVSSTRAEEAVDANGGAVTSGRTTVVHTGLTTAVFDEVGRRTRFTYDAFGRTVRSEAGKDRFTDVPTDYVYGGFGTLDFVIRRDSLGAPAAGRVTEMQYDGLGRRTVLKEPGSGTRTRKYNAFGEIREETDAQNIVSVYARDKLGRPTKVTDGDGTTTFLWDTATHGIGRLAESTSPSGVTRRFSYDSLGRISRETWTVDGKTYRLDYTFTPTGRVATVAYPEVPNVPRFIVKHSFDPDTGAVFRVQKEGATKAYWTLAETEVDGQTKKEIFGNDVVTSYQISRVSGRVAGMTTTRPGSSIPLRSWFYDYLPDGSLRRRSNFAAGAPQNERFWYDTLGRLSRWENADATGKPLANGWSVTYDTDDFGSMTGRQFAPGATTGGTAENLVFTMEPTSERLVSSPWGNYGYDAVGRQTERPDGETITYTSFDLPRTITGPRAATFAYDAFGTRVKKQKTGSNISTVYVGGLYEKRTSGSVSSPVVDHVFYVSGPSGVVAQVTRREGSTNDTTLYLHSDVLGSTDAVTDATSAVVQSTKRDPYGNAVADFNKPTLMDLTYPNTNKVRLGFTGHEQDEDLALVNMRGRMQDARTGRFLTPDPVVQAPWSGASHNRYSYVLNNPTTYVDPSGFQTSCSRDLEVLRAPDGRWAATGFPCSKDNIFFDGQRIDPADHVTLTEQEHSGDGRVYWFDNSIWNTPGPRPQEPLPRNLRGHVASGRTLSRGSMEGRPKTGTMADANDGSGATSASRLNGSEITTSGAGDVDYSDWDQWGRINANYMQDAMFNDLNGQMDRTVRREWAKGVAINDAIVVGTLVGGGAVSLLFRGTARLAGGAAVGGGVRLAEGAGEALVTTGARHLGAAAANVSFRAIEGTRGLLHSFKHASQWFGREVTAKDLPAWQALVERASGSSLQVSWSAFNAPTVGHLARIDGKYFFVQFYSGGKFAGELATAFVPNRSQLSAILKLLE